MSTGDAIHSYVELPAALKRRVVRTIVDWEAREYGVGQSIRSAALDGRICRHEDGLLCVLSRGWLAGFVSVVPIGTSAYDRLRSGAVREEQMPSRWIRCGASPSRCWYVASLVVAREIRATQTRRARALSAALQFALWSHVRRCSRLPVRVIGIAATEVGHAKFLQTGFRAVPVAPGAVDGRTRFEQVLRGRGDFAARRADGVRG